MIRNELIDMIPDMIDSGRSDGSDDSKQALKKTIQANSLLMNPVFCVFCFGVYVLFFIGVMNELIESGALLYA